MTINVEEINTIIHYHKRMVCIYENFIEELIEEQNELQGTKEINIFASIEYDVCLTIDLNNKKNAENELKSQ